MAKFKFNYRKLAMENLNLTIADLRNSGVRDAILIEVIRLQDLDKSNSRSSTFLRQSDIASVLETFPGFSNDPEQYGPTVAEITDFMNADRDENDKVSRNRVAQHLSKLRSEEIIQSAPKMESAGRRGRPEVFYFLVNEEMFKKILDGEYIAKG